MTIKTLNADCEFICFFDLTADEQAEFDHLDADQREEGNFFRHDGQIFCCFDFLRADAGGEIAEAGYHGYQPVTAFSAYLLKLDGSGDRGELALLAA